MIQQYVGSEIFPVVRISPMTLTRGSKEYKDHLLRLRGSVCNTAERKVCCRNENPIPKSDK